MGKLVIAVMVMLGSLGLQASDWSAVLDGVERKVLRLEMQGAAAPGPGICSGVVLNATAGFLLTAAHCVDGKDVQVTVDGRHAAVTKTNRVLDLAVVRFSPRPSHRAVKLATDAPKMGTEVAVVGFPFGVEELHTQFGHVARQQDEGELYVNADIIPGNSGGALLNPAGELVGVNVAVRFAFGGAAHMGVAVALETLRDFAAEYLPKD